MDLNGYLQEIKNIKGGETMTKEYRWENVRIGQGHHYSNLIQCLKDAHDASFKMWPDDLITVEQLKPERLTLVLMRGGVENIIMEVGI